MAIDPAPWNEANLHSFNRYAFANNNPTRFTDPDGAQPIPFQAAQGGAMAGLEGFAMSQPLRANPGKSAEIARAYDQPGFDTSANLPSLPGFGIPSAAERFKFYGSAGFPGVVLGALDYIINAVSQREGGTYVLTDKNGTVMRCGQTCDLGRREKEHERQFPELRFRVDLRSDSYAERRGREQIIHDRYAPPLDRQGPNSKRNQNRETYLRAGARAGEGDF